MAEREPIDVLQETVASHGHQLSAHAARLAHLEHEAQWSRKAWDRLQDTLAQQNRVIADLQVVIVESRAEQVRLMNQILDRLQPKAAL